MCHFFSSFFQIRLAHQIRACKIKTNAKWLNTNLSKDSTRKIRQNQKVHQASTTKFKKKANESIYQHEWTHDNSFPLDFFQFCFIDPLDTTPSFRRPQKIKYKKKKWEKNYKNSFDFVLFFLSLSTRNLTNTKIRLW